jgi:hypothetical protein
MAENVQRFLSLHTRALHLLIPWLPCGTNSAARALGTQDLTSTYPVAGVLHAAAAVARPLTPPLELHSKRSNHAIAIFTCV